MRLRPFRKGKPRVRRRRTRALREELFNLPNILTMGRVAIIPVVLLFVAWSDERDCGLWEARRNAVIATILFSAAAITDFFDGFLARVLNLGTVFGRFLDPLADKLLVMACLVQLSAMGRIPAWFTVLLLSREISITGLRQLATEEGLEIHVTQTAKWKTALQLAGLVGLLLHFPLRADYLIVEGTIDYHRVGLALMTASMVFSLASAAGYLAGFIGAIFAKRGSVTGPSATEG